MEEKKTKYNPYSFRKISIIFFSMVLIVVLFSSGGLLNWAKRFEYGTARQFWVSLIQSIDDVAELLYLNVPKEILEGSFKNFSGLEEATEQDFFNIEISDSLTVGDTLSRQIIDISAVDDSIRINKKQRSDYSKENPIKVLLIGDSMMGGGLGTLLSRTFRRDTLFFAKRFYELSSGLNRIDVYDWYAKTEEVLAENEYDILVVNFGTNDVQSIKKDSINYYNFSNPEWKEEYSKRVDKYLQLIHDKFELVYWLELPHMRKEKFGKNLSKLNEIFRDKIKAYPNIAFFKTSELLADSNNTFCSFKEVNKKRVRIRMDDGIHYTNAGGKIVALEIRKRILKDLY